VKERQIKRVRFVREPEPRGAERAS
jgi:hypothetical protein